MFGPAVFRRRRRYDGTRPRRRALFGLDDLPVELNRGRFGGRYDDLGPVLHPLDGRWAGGCRFDELHFFDDLGTFCVRESEKRQSPLSAQRVERERQARRYTHSHFPADPNNFVDLMFLQRQQDDDVVDLEYPSAVFDPNQLPRRNMSHLFFEGIA